MTRQRLATQEISKSYKIWTKVNIVTVYTLSRTKTLKNTLPSQSMNVYILFSPNIEHELGKRRETINALPVPI